MLISPKADATLIEVTVLFLNDGYASVATVACDVFRSVGLFWNACTGGPKEPRFRVTTASIDGRPAESEGALALAPQASINQIRHTDLIFVPDAGMDIDRMIDRHRPLIPWLRDRHARGAHIAGACSGVALLAEAGMLDGRRATTHWALADAFVRRYPKVHWRTDAFVTEDGGLVCGGGIYACVDLSLYLVEKFCGHTTALECAKALLLEMPRTHQAGFAVLPLATPHSDARIRKAEEWIQGRYREAIRVERIAAAVSMSPRNFERRFKAATGEMPLVYLQKLRVAAAKRMLEQERQSIQAVGSAVGYSDVQFFRMLFKRQTGMSPAAYRERFGAPPVTSTRQQ